MELFFEDIIRQNTPALNVALITADVTVKPTDDLLWDEIEKAAKSLSDTHEISEVNKIPAISATRSAYKIYGKDPNRYRPSAEALARRAVKGLGLYRTLNLIDLINLLSLSSGHSIGAFDAEKIEGDTLTLGVGRHAEPYTAIGRGELNIEGLPVWRDKHGGVGTPTSDNDRTKITPDTDKVVITLNCYSNQPDINETSARIAQLLQQYCDARNIAVKHYKP